MSKRCARPGMPPSPNQALVLGVIMNMTPGPAFYPRWSGVTIDTVRAQFASQSPSSGDGLWSRSTVRDHMNDLAAKEHLQKRIISGTGYYRPMIAGHSMTEERMR